MTILLQVQGALKQYASKILLDHTDMTIFDGQKVGFIGRNGAGKSTLCRIILEQEELEEGSIKRHPDLRLGYLRQHDPFLPGETVLDFLVRDSGLEDWRCGKIAGQFELKNQLLDTSVHELSGGWQTRVKLAALLLKDPNLLILDEPTNFLDVRTQMLLEQFLKDFRGAYLIVSHDRGFLNATCDHTLEIRRGQLSMYKGNVDSFLTQQEEQRQRDERSNATIMSKRKQLERFIAKNKGYANTAAQARSKEKQLERLELIELGSEETRATIRVPQVEERKGTALRCVNLAIGYPDKVVAKDVRVEVEYGECAVVVGDNGQGKTTFLRTIVGSLEPKEGELTWGFGCEIGVYAQHVYTSLPESQTVFDYLALNAASEVSHQRVLDVAGSFLFRGHEIEKKISVLSGGERARLCLAALFLGNHTVLVLDEPGNHLDVETLESLVSALKEYRGTVILTSHDRHFISHVATSVVEVHEGRVVNYPGDYENYLYRVRQQIDEGLRGPSKKAKKAAKAKVPTETKEQRKARARQQHEMRRQLKSVERRLDKLTERKRELDEALSDISDADEAQRLYDEQQKVNAELEEVEETWLELQEKTGEL